MMKATRISKYRIPAFLLLFCLFVLPVQAADPMDENKTGSLTITLYEGDTPVGNGELIIWQVGTISTSTNGLSFVLSAPFAGSKVPLTHPENKTVIEALNSYAKTTSIPGTVRSIPENGSVHLDSLPAGLYLVVQTGTPKGYETMSPFLISVPIWDAESSSWKYDVDAYPKSEVASSESSQPSTKPTKPVTNKNPNTGVMYFWMEYCGIGLIAAILLFLYFAGSRKRPSIRG